MTSDTANHNLPTLENQDAIWDYFQNEQQESFRHSLARIDYLFRQTKPNSRVLNIGVGSGLFEEIALKAGRDVYSLDPTERSIESLRKRFGMGEKALVGYSQQTPFPDNYFEYIVISEVIEHLSPEVTAQTLNEICRTLKPDGTLLGTVPARENLMESIVVCPCCQQKFHRWGHLQSFTANSMQALLQTHFQEVHTHERPFVTFSPLNWKGKLIGAIKLMLYFAGVHGSDENVVFRAISPRK